MRKIIRVCIGIALLVSGPHPTYATWPQIGHDAASTFRTGTAVRPPFRLRLAILGDSYFRSVVADEKNLYVLFPPEGARADGRTTWLASISRHDGNLNWILESKDNAETSCLAVDGPVIYTSTGGNVCAIDINGRYTYWTTHTGKRPYDIRFDGGMLYVSFQDRVSCLDASNGEELWQNTLFSYVDCVSDEAVYCEDRHWLYKVDKKSGMASWKYWGAAGARFIDGMLYTPAGPITQEGRLVCTKEERGLAGFIQTCNKRVCLGVAGNQLFALAPDCGPVAWRSRMPVSSISLGGDIVYALGELHSGPHRWQFSAVDASSGRSIWRYNSSIGGYYSLAPIILDDLASVATSSAVFGFSAYHRGGAVVSAESRHAVPYVIEIDGKRIRSSVIVRRNVPYVPIRDIYDAYGYRSFYTTNGLLVNTHYPIPAYPATKYRVPLRPAQALKAVQSKSSVEMFPNNWQLQTDDRVPILDHGRFYFALDKFPLAQGMAIWKPELRRIVLVGLRASVVHPLPDLPHKQLLSQNY